MPRKRIIVRTLTGGVTRKWWIMQEWRTCNCPDCDKEGHWFDWSWRWYMNLEDALRYHPGAIVENE